MTIRHSRRPDHITTGRAFLLSVIHRPDQRLPRYAEFAGSYGGIARGAAPVLNSIARNCATQGEPDLSVLVVRSQTALPGMVDGHPVEPDNPASIQRWHAELTRVRQYHWPAQ